MVCGIQVGILDGFWKWTISRKWTMQSIMSCLNHYKVISWKFGSQLWRRSRATSLFKWNFWIILLSKMNLLKYIFVFQKKKFGIKTVFFFRNEFRHSWWPRRFKKNLLIEITRNETTKIYFCFSDDIKTVFSRAGIIASMETIPEYLDVCTKIPEMNLLKCIFATWYSNQNCIFERSLR